MNVFEARLRNAQRMGRRIQSLIDQGYVVRDAHDTKVHAMEVTDSAVYRLTADGKCRIMYFENDPEMDHGLHTKIAEWNALFVDWTYTRPEHVRPLVKKTKEIVNAINAAFCA